MTVNCKHWEDCGVIGGGCCKIDKFPKPTEYICNNVCKLNTIKTPSRMRITLDPDLIVGQKDVLERMIKDQEEIPPNQFIGNELSPKKKCKSCNSRKLKDIILGGAKLLKAELGMDACDEKTVRYRRSLCEPCEHYDFGVCEKCGCFCAAKVKLKSEVCPIGKW